MRLSAVRLHKVRILTGEFLPFDVNDIVALNQRLCSTSCYAHPTLHHASPHAHVGIHEVLQDTIKNKATKVHVLDAEETSFCNFEAMINVRDRHSTEIDIEHLGVH